MMPAASPSLACPPPAVKGSSKSILTSSCPPQPGFMADGGSQTVDFKFLAFIYIDALMRI